MREPRANRKRVGGRTIADTRTLTVRFSTELVEALKITAEEQGASVTSLIEALALSNRSVKKTLEAVSANTGRAQMSSPT